MRVGGATLSGKKRDRTKVLNGQQDDGYWLKARKSIGAAVKALAEVNGGFEYRMDYLRDSTGQFLAQYTLGYPTVGVDKALTFEWPSGNIAKGQYASDAGPFRTRVDVIGGMLGDNPVHRNRTGLRPDGRGLPVRVGDANRIVHHGEDQLDDKAIGRLCSSAVQ